MTGGTLTLSNIGSIGGVLATPLVYGAESAIVALGRIQVSMLQSYLCGAVSLYPYHVRGFRVHLHEHITRTKPFVCLHVAVHQEFVRCAACNVAHGGGHAGAAAL